MPDHFMKLGTRYVNYLDKKKKKNTIEKKKKFLCKWKINSPTKKKIFD